MNLKVYTEYGTAATPIQSREALKRLTPDDERYIVKNLQSKPYVVTHLHEDNDDHIELAYPSVKKVYSAPASVGGEDDKSNLQNMIRIIKNFGKKAYRHLLKLGEPKESKPKNLSKESIVSQNDRLSQNEQDDLENLMATLTEDTLSYYQSRDLRKPIKQFTKTINKNKKGSRERAQCLCKDLSRKLERDVEISKRVGEFYGQWWRFEEDKSSYNTIDNMLSILDPNHQSAPLSGSGKSKELKKENLSKESSVSQNDRLSPNEQKNLKRLMATLTEDKLSPYQSWDLRYPIKRLTITINKNQKGSRERAQHLCKDLYHELKLDVDISERVGRLHGQWSGFKKNKSSYNTIDNMLSILDPNHQRKPID